MSTVEYKINWITAWIWNVLNIYSSKIIFTASDNFAQEKYIFGLQIKENPHIKYQYMRNILHNTSAKISYLKYIIYKCFMPS